MGRGEVSPRPFNGPLASGGGRIPTIGQEEPIVMVNSLPVVQLARPGAHSHLQF